MNAGTTVILLQDVTTPDALVIVRTRRLNADQVEVTIYGTSFTRILLYVGSDVVFDSDDAGDAATIQTDTDGNTRVTITSLEDGLGAPAPRSAIPATAFDQVLTTPSDATEFIIKGVSIALPFITIPLG